uniref:Uncharacterized protein n=1 Tax=Ditylenchus dipsaci TaxID=166011 RepID=A0A915CLL9_9BILA
MPKVFVPISSIWSSDECDASGTTTSTSRGSPSDCRKAFSSSANGCKPEQEDIGQGSFNDSAGCLTELRDKLADGLLLDKLDKD